MTPRENLLSLWRRTGFETIPVEFGLCPSLVEEFKRQTGAEDYREYFDMPFQPVSGPAFTSLSQEEWHEHFKSIDRPLKPGTHVDPLGVAHETGSEEAMHMRHKRHPMRPFDSLEQFQAYPYPTVEEGALERIRDEVTAAKEAGYVAMGHAGCTIWEKAWGMRGMEELMMDMLAAPEMAAYHLDKLTDLACERVGAYAAAGVDHVHLGDDIGMQQSIMMSMEMWREWLKPRLGRVIDTMRAENPDLMISYHSCGYVEPFIPELIELGIDVLNPVQPECMPFGKLHAEFGDCLSFWGTIGTQTTMPFGTPEDVRAEVIKNLEIAGPKGGLLPAPTHLLEPEVPWANIMAYVEACREFTTAGA
jgi:uroporphyrinogen decarboxylase